MPYLDLSLLHESQLLVPAEGRSRDKHGNVF